MDEITLAKKLRQGSRLALERAIDRFTPYVSAVVVRVLAGRGAREDVEELTADVFLALWAHAGELDPEQGLRPWLGAVARNRAMDWLRTHKEAAPLPEDAAAPGGADPQAEAERREWAARLWDAVEGLDEPDRTLFLRYYYCGDKLKDIARALGLTQTAAKQRLFRGRKALRDTLTKGGVEA
ncbi:sigma-70 family RNA polymerase sigma factor [Flavonifractor plautii]|nr:sigma-70 family RNA polymerase sigma factor [Flavonifractor plautii]MDB7881657.1 sigma-70 family RNA polymerase sigma factor [Flavonifractor plautii]MDB7957375.1 sigma-70 family RNA polymerase sigma factor [Flavonifractor plautii]